MSEAEAARCFGGGGCGHLARPFEKHSVNVIPTGRREVRV